MPFGAVEPWKDPATFPDTGIFLLPSCKCTAVNVTTELHRPFFRSKEPLTAQDRDRERALVNPVMKFRVP